MSTFAFTETNLHRAREILKRYPEAWSMSAVMPLLDLAQRQNGGSLSKETIFYVADFLKIEEIRVWEVATFYSMYQLKPVGTYVVQVCTTTPCWLMDSNNILRTCQKWLGIKPGETTQDTMFTLQEVECLGACANGPMMKINDAYYEDLEEASVVQILEALSQGETPQAGSQKGRVSSEPKAPGGGAAC